MTKSALAACVIVAFAVGCGAVNAGPTGEAADAAMRTEVSQYGITWTFDKPYPTGRFITGDWWVVGPVTVVSVSPEPAPTDQSDTFGVSPNRWGDTAFQDDGRMRNGSMIVLKASTSQGYDSRKRNYRPEDSVAFPCELAANRSLLSSISQTRRPQPNFLKGWHEKDTDVVKTVAVLTCLPAAPPADAFRPPFAGTDKPIYRAAALKRELLPKLKPVEGVPDVDEVIRYFQRPWVDHMNGWLRVSVNENFPRYGRETSRIVGFGGCMLLLDIPQAKKEQLLRGLVQVGVDLYGLSLNGKNWSADGGHYGGRKFPIVFAGLMLGEEKMLHAPKEIRFQEDMQSYYGKGVRGDNVLWQMCFHHQPTGPYEQKDPADWTGMDKRSEGYRRATNGHSWVGFALAARWLKLIGPWGHDAMFDYCDRWMGPQRSSAKRKGLVGRWGGAATDPWITAMWRAYRDAAPAQRGADENFMWVWKKGRTGAWVANPKPARLYVDPATIAVTAGDFEDSKWGRFAPENTLDGDLSATSSWRAEGPEKAWIRFDLGEEKTITGVELAFLKGNQRRYTVAIETSADGETWTERFRGANSGYRLALEPFNFPAAAARYVRIVGYGNDNEKFAAWTNITEAKIRLKP